MNATYRWLCLALCAAGCGGSGPMGGDDVGDDVPDPPDAVIGCTHDSCGLPSDDPCCAGTTCSNWDLLGPVECAQECTTNADCDSGCCVELTNGAHTCGPAGFCDAGGAVPEYLCHENVECGWSNDYTACTRAVTACVDNLSAADQHAWLQAMAACGAPDANACDTAYLDCWLNQVPWC